MRRITRPAFSCLRRTLIGAGEPLLGESAQQPLAGIAARSLHASAGPSLAQALPRLGLPPHLQTIPLQGCSQGPQLLPLHPAGQLRHIGCGMNTCAADLSKTAPKIIVEYDPAKVDVFIAIADAIEDVLPSVLVEGNESGDGRPGSFEISTEDGTSIFSLLAAPHTTPDPEKIIELITKSNVAAASSATA